MSLYSFDFFGNQIYPVIEIEYNGKKIRVEKASDPPEILYAKKNNGKPYYPLGIDGHEYYLDTLEEPDDYPISNDGFYLVPLDVLGQPVINDTFHAGVKQAMSLPIEEKQIIDVFKGKQGIQRAIKTNIRSKRIPRKLRVPISYWLFFAICLIVSVIVIRLIFR